MRMVKDGWLSQRRRVNRLRDFVLFKRAQESDLRAATRASALDLLARFESLFLIGATGAVWASRIRERSEDEPRRPIAHLIAAVFVVSRWRRLAALAQSRWASR